jgi:hypothetical protein
VDLVGIEPTFAQCECAVLPLNYRPSGRWELNPDYILPKDAYYLYTTPR